MTTQTKREELLALADRCEREEASREIDVRIFLALNNPAILVLDDTADRFPRPSKHVPAGSIWDETWPHWSDPREVKDVALTLSCPTYTTSLDAAVTLVPLDDGRRWFWRVGESSLYKGWAHLNRLHPDHCDRKDEATANAATPALALCSAALRARASLTDGAPEDPTKVRSI